MEIRLQLFSILREKLPAEKKGKTTLNIDEGTTLADILEMYDINQRVAISVNGVQIRDHSRELQDGEEIKIFTSVGGG